MLHPVAESKWTVKFEKDHSRKGHELALPLGFDVHNALANQTGGTEQEEEGSQAKIKHKLAWKLATGQITQLPMNMLMMWMSGNQINMWSVMMIGMFCFSPVKAIITMNENFSRLSLATDLIDFRLQKLAYFAASLAGVALAAYKLSNIGLIPTTASDFLEFVTQGERREFSAGGVI